MKFRGRLLIVLLLLALFSVNIASAQQRVPDQPIPNGMTAKEQQHAALKAATDTSGGVISLAPRVAPANDNLASAAAITLPFQTLVVDIQDATVESGKIAFCSGNNQDVWFKFTLANPAVIDMVLLGSSYDTVLTVHKGPTAAASASELEFVICNDDISAGSSYLTSGLLGQALAAGTYYLQISDYGTTPALDADLIISVQETGAPQPFSYYYPYPDTYALAPYEYEWSSSALATSYDFTMYQTNALRATVEVFSLTNLTPAVDTDPLNCNPTCTLVLDSSSTALITTLGDYLWVVKAKNSIASIDAVNIDDDDVFSTNFTETPTEFYLFSQQPVLTGDPTTYNWSNSLDALTYDLVVNQTAPVVEPNVLQLNNLTPQDDGDGLSCDIYNCLLTLNPAIRAARLDDNATYEWNVTAENTNGGTLANTPGSFELDSTPLPGNFYTGAGSLHNDPATTLSTILMLPSRYADSYDVVLQRTAPAAADILNVTGLTPADDSDALTCEAEFFCGLTIADAGTTFIDGNYTLTATAVNANGSTVSAGSPEEFTVNSGLGFTLQTPADGTTVETAAEITSFTWSEMTEPTATIQYYRMDFDSSFAPGWTGVIQYLTPAADNDVLTCAAGTCTLAASAQQLGLKRNTHGWYVYASGTHSEGGFNLDNSGADSVFTIGDVPTNFSILNGDFENYNADTKLPADWAVKGTLTGSKVKCNKVDKVFAVSGVCAWTTKGVVTNGGLGQNPDAVNILAGDSVTLSGWLSGKNVTKGRVQMKIKYDTDPTGKLTLDAAPGNSAYIYYETTVGVTAIPTKIKLKVSNKSSSGKLQVDNLQAWVTLSDSTLLALPGVLPLPAVVESGLSNSRSVPESNLETNK
ncbi:MAG: hypothetical protein H7X77_07800 [Anaerolineae bacterium]|nr:hypothetical protein [Anaerolineae bacterium]